MFRFSSRVLFEEAGEGDAGGGSPPATPPVVPPATAPETPPGDPAWLPDRLKQASSTAVKAVLKELGFGSKAELEKALKDGKAAAEAQLSEQERIKKQLDELTPKAQRAEKFEKLFGEVAQAKFDALPDAVKAAINERAGDDLEQRWSLMKFAEATGGIKPATPIPASTAPAGATPPPAPGSVKNDWEKYNDLLKSDPMAASLFYQMNSSKIEKARATR